MSKKIEIPSNKINENFSIQMKNTLNGKNKEELADSHSGALTINTFFEALGYSQEKIDGLKPTYTKYLFKKGIDFEVMTQTLFNLIEVWDSKFAPTVAEIIQKYKVLKSKNSRERMDPEFAAVGQTSDFWKIWNQCRAEGITNLGIIAKYLEKGIDWSKKKKGTS